MDTRLEDIFLRALELTGSARLGYLDEACAGSPDERRQIETLLASEGSANGYFRRLSSQLDGLLGQFDDNFDKIEVPPDRIGDYQPSRLLGRGGMGVVYLASRSDGQFDKQVAIKVLPTLLASPEAEQRFVRERQILAGLDHPNICHLLDGGVTVDGLPYFVMDYVVGVPIDRHADDQRFSIESRLDLFLQVCAAVEHAHQNLILHRDIKPGNILVTESGQAKLLDFGIAKVISESEQSGQSQTTQLPLTPRFASPEQLRGQPVTTRADVYALGILLYSLLTGVHAHKLQQRSPSESLRILAEHEPTLASHRLKDLRRKADASEFVADTAGQRQLNPQSLINRLGGDLDNILAKALRHDPADRYSSVAALADDIRRHLNHQPVLARPPSLGYVASRFARRHRLPVALSAVIASLLLTLAAVAAWSAWETKQQAEVIVAESARADATKDFLISVFRAAHPNQAKGEIITARQLVDSGAQRVQTELEDRPTLQASLLNTFADIYSLLGEYGPADELWQQELALRQQLAGPSSPAVANVLDNLSRIASAQGQHDRAVNYAEQAVAIRKTVDDPLGLANSQFRVARLAENANDLDRAERGYRQVLAVYADHPEARGQHSMTLNMLGNVLRRKDQLEDALAMIEQALAEQLRGPGENNAFTAQILQDLGSTQRALERTVEAEQSYQRALAIAEKLFGPDHREVGFALSGLATLAETNQKPDLAEQRYARALEIFERQLGASHPNVGVTLMNLGAFYRRQNNCAQAEPQLRQGLKVMQAALPSHGSVAVGQQNLAGCVLKAGHTEEAETLLLAAHSAQVSKLGEKHKHTRATAADLAEFYRQAQQPAAAARYAKLGEEP